MDFLLVVAISLVKYGTLVAVGSKLGFEIIKVYKAVRGL